MPRRTAAALIAVVAVAASTAVLLFWDTSDGFDESLARFSNLGQPIEMAVPEKLGPPSWPKLTGRAILISERGRVRFLRLPRVDGSSCWATSERRFGLWQLTNYGCEVGLARFPDRNQPVMVVSRVEVERDAPLLRYHSFHGFAADGVKRLAVVDPQNRVVPVAEVVDNVFYAATPPDDVKAVVALDAAGEVIWRGAEVRLQDE